MKVIGPFLAVIGVFFGIIGFIYWFSATRTPGS